MKYITIIYVRYLRLPALWVQSPAQMSANMIPVFDYPFQHLPLRNQKKMSIQLSHAFKDTLSELWKKSPSFTVQ